ncbi:MAG: O-antigen ligase family protein [Aureliella sp.]
MNSVAAQQSTTSSPRSGWALLLESERALPVVACFLVLAVAVFSGPIDIAEGITSNPEMRFGRAPSIALKLLNAVAAGAIGAWGVCCVPRVRSLLLTPPGLMLCAVAGIFLLTSVTSISGISLPLALVFLAYLIFVPTCLTVLGLRGVMASALGGVSLFIVGALLLYVFMPAYGVYPEEFGDGIVVERLSGMSQPNHTGRAAMLGLILAAYFFRLPSAPRRLCLVLAAMFVVAGILAMSRTALLAAAICLVILNLDLVLTRAGIALASLAGVGALGGLFVLAAAGRDEMITQKVLGALTKTGEVEEFTSLTGRSEIWRRTTELIQQRPLQGWGLGAAKIVLVDHLQSTHNILLHPTLAAGIGAGLLTLGLLVWNLINVFTCPQLIIRALSAFLLISGLSEDTIYETFPGACTVLWLTCCLWPVMLAQPVAKANSGLA